MQANLRAAAQQVGRLSLVLEKKGSSRAIMKKTFATFSLAALLLGGVAVFAQEQALAEADANNTAGKEKLSPGKAERQEGN